MPDDVESRGRSPGSAAGVTVTANKFKGVRAAPAMEPSHAKHLRTNDDIRVICLSADWTDTKTAVATLKVFLETPFSNEPRHVRRLEKVANLENNNFK